MIRCLCPRTLSRSAKQTPKSTVEYRLWRQNWHQMNLAHAHYDSWRSKSNLKPSHHKVLRPKTDCRRLGDHVLLSLLRVAVDLFEGCHPFHNFRDAVHVKRFHALGYGNFTNVCG